MGKRLFIDINVPDDSSDITVPTSMQRALEALRCMSVALMQRVIFSVLRLSVILISALTDVSPGHAEMLSAEMLYAVRGGANRSLYAIDLTTGVQSTVGNTNLPRPGLQALTATSTGVLYSMTYEFENSNYHLLTLNPSTGAATDLGAINANFVTTAAGTVPSMGVDAAGNLYGVWGNGNVFASINPATLDVTQIGVLNDGTGTRTAQALAFSPSGILYGWATAGIPGQSNGLYTVNPGTGHITFVNPGVSNNTNYLGLTFTPDGTLWGYQNEAANGELDKINLTTGASRFAFNGLNNELTDIAFAPVPVPAAIWLFGTGIVSVMGFARRMMNQKRVPQAR